MTKATINYLAMARNVVVVPPKQKELPHWVDVCGACFSVSFAFGALLGVLL